MKDQREALTRDHIAKKLTRESKHTMLRSVLFFILGALFQGVLFMAYAPSKDIRSLAFGGLGAACIFFFGRAVLRIIAVRHGKFDVVEDTLSEIKESRFNLLRALLSKVLFSRSNYDHIFRFESGKRFVANCGELVNTGVDVAANFSMVGDTFYLVSYSYNPKKILWIYSTKIYNYEPTDN